MTSADIYYLLPLIIISLASIVVMLSVAIKRSYVFASMFTIAAFLGAAVSVIYIDYSKPHMVSSLLRLDNFAAFFAGLIFVAGILVTMLSITYLESREENREEYFIILLIATLGASVLVSAVNFISFFIGLEILSVSLYILIAYTYTEKKSVEAGLKYLILASASSAFLLFGMALVYVSAGSMEFGEAALAIFRDGLGYYSAAGIALMTVGIGFKLAVVPFHMWTADVYEGAPAPVTAFIATISKGGMIALVFRFFIEINAYQYDIIILIFTVIAIASMLVGNLLALLQTNIKRILAYSSIAHLGYMLIALIAGGQNGAEAVTFYLSAYFITILGAFGVVIMLSGFSGEAASLENYKGLFWRKPWLAAVFTAMLLSLAGIPLTAGFIGKFYVAAAGVYNSLWLLVVILVAGSVISIFYYLRVVAAMFSTENKKVSVADYTYSFSGALSLIIITLLLFWFGIFPAGLLEVIKASVVSLYF